MRKIEWTSQFKRDFKRELKGQHRVIIHNHLFSIIGRLANNETLDVCYLDHALSGNLKDYRNCHIKPDLILIYQKTKITIIRLIRLGSHSQLGI